MDFFEGFLAVFIGGGIGASLRYLISLYFKRKFNVTFWATFLINVLGCLFLGYFAAFLLKNPLFNHKIYLFLTTGIAGGFTTFSTFGLENFELLKEGKIAVSMLYMSLSMVFGLLAVFAGFSIAMGF